MHWIHTQIPGFVAPVHRALTVPILMGGAPRSIAIVNGTLAAALQIRPVANVQIKKSSYKLEHGAKS